MRPASAGSGREMSGLFFKVLERSAAFFKRQLWDWERSYLIFMTKRSLEPALLPSRAPVVLPVT
jgi:hypothetical protein